MATKINKSENQLAKETLANKDFYFFSKEKTESPNTNEPKYILSPGFLIGKVKSSGPDIINDLSII